VLALNNLAWVYSQQGNKQAIEYAEKAYKLAPHSPAIADTYGYILVLQGKAREGVEVLKLAFRKAPQIGDIQFHLAKGYSLLGQKEKAINLLDALEKKGLSFSEKSNLKKLLKKLQSE
jgi:predicted Zn-dependent protease